MQITMINEALFQDLDSVISILYMFLKVSEIGRHTI